MRANIAVLRTGVLRHGVELLDYSEALGQDDFVDRQWACEHLAFEGRRQLASLLALTISPARQP